jgi:hypothetical protein
VTALLVLLALLSVAMLFSQQGAFDELVERASTPVLVGLGFALSPAGFGFLSASTLNGLAPAVDVGVFWLAVLAGLRASSLLPAALRAPEGRRAAVLAVVAAAVASLVAGGVLQAAAGVAHGIGLKGSLPAALLVGASLSGMPGERGASAVRAAYSGTAQLVVLVAALVSLFLWTGRTELVVVGALGCVGAVVVRLILPRGESGGVPAPIAYLAVAVLLAGLSRLAAVPGAIAGFLLGSLVARIDAVLAGASPNPAPDALLATERPVRIVVTTVLAAITAITMTDAIVGAALGISVVLVQYFVSLALTDGTSLLERLGATVATSTTPLVAVAAFSSAHIDGAKALLPVILVAVAVADAVAFTMSLAARAGPRLRAASGGSAP